MIVLLELMYTIFLFAFTCKIKVVGNRTLPISYNCMHLWYIIKHIVTKFIVYIYNVVVGFKSH